MVNFSEADWFHIDIMDGFVPNILNAVLEAIKKHANKTIDVRPRLLNQTDISKNFDLGSDILTVHKRHTFA